ncbi:MAG: SLC13 family permease [Porticoccaceae bacterium]|nr:SLC13 family permease [Porticoccaceae bacterium]
MKSLLMRGAVLVVGIMAIMGLVEAERSELLGLVMLWTIAFLWISETFHITITALLVPVLAVAMGLLDMQAALANFAHPIIFLFLGGFALAAAMQAQGLDKWLARSVLHFTQGRLSHAVVLLAAVTVPLSFWISNTAVIAMMLPLVLGLLAQKEELSLQTQSFCLLLIAYSATIGGMGTVVASPPNAIVAAELGLNFVQWLYVGIPMVLLLWPLMLGVLYLVLKPDFADGRVAVDSEPFEWTSQRKTLLVIFVLTVSGWLLGQPLSLWLGVGNTDTWVALMALVLLAMTKVVDWKGIEKSADWGVLLLFGGGLTLSAVLGSSGASEYLGFGLARLIEGWGIVLIMLALVAFVQFFGEITSNTAATALLVPIFVTLPAEVVSPTQAVLAVGICASCAFMLPVATPPNALVHGTGKVPQKTMMRVGLVLNLSCTALLTVVFSQFYQSL